MVLVNKELPGTCKNELSTFKDGEYGMADGENTDFGGRGLRLNLNSAT